jgi:hypothetical protein
VINARNKKVYVKIPEGVIQKCFVDYGSIINEYSIYLSSIKNQGERLFNLAKQYLL